MKIIDISLPLTDGMPIYPGTSPTVIKPVKSGSGQSILADIHMSSHAGSHIDAPLHALPSGNPLSKLDLETFYGPCRVLDLSNCQELISEKDLLNKNIAKGERILLKTNNSSRSFGSFYDDYVYLSTPAAAYLAKKGVKLVGIDALSIKKRGDKDNSSHTNLLSKNIPIIEGLNLSNAGEGIYTLVALPIALQADGAPTRAILIDEKHNNKGKTLKNSGLKLYTDGGSRGNPGHSAIAYVICDLEDNVVEKTGKYIGQTTNNQAEYQALIAGLERVKLLGASEIDVFLDSELVIKQINGQYKIKKAELLPLYQQIQVMKSDFKSIKFIHVPRELNKEADGEVNRILDEKKL